MLNHHELSSINWNKVNGLIPCIIQNFSSSEVLMHGYMNELALQCTQKTKFVTFYSRTKKRLWKKGETSGNYLKVLNIVLDCDHDSILILVDSIGKTCHLNNTSCFDGYKTQYTNFFYLEKKIKDKKKHYFNDSYTSYLHKLGVNRIAQKLGEESIETVIASINNNTQEFVNEATDLIYHLLVLLHNQNLSFSHIIKNLEIRNKKIK
ncbi:bifunctional phosphoribosyl-AMP cyclohydrolase/phosphoribosyl-ATP diphosphatase HisIE [Buchnera aphidicola]|uniref:bifunctional phosphoribosyl-AMP cyclohydrolase/phosphoribosyl-ATP diphosphatase HisIE n=1 Tax=Buchnera aphidicola TaxID=9 RepID=UPI0034649380